MTTAFETQAVSGESLLEQRPPLVAAGRRELADDGRVGHLRRGQVERRREVDDDRVDLVVLQRGDDVVGVVEDLADRCSGRSRR